MKTRTQPERRARKSKLESGGQTKKAKVSSPSLWREAAGTAGTAAAAAAAYSGPGGGQGGRGGGSGERGSGFGGGQTRKPKVCSLSLSLRRRRLHLAAIPYLRAPLLAADYCRCGVSWPSPELPLRLFR